MAHALSRNKPLPPQTEKMWWKLLFYSTETLCIGLEIDDELPMMMNFLCGTMELSISWDNEVYWVLFYQRVTSSISHNFLPFFYMEDSNSHTLCHTWYTHFPNQLTNSSGQSISHHPMWCEDRLTFILEDLIVKLGITIETLLRQEN